MPGYRPGSCGGTRAGLNQGRIDIARLRRTLVGVPLPRAADGRLVLAVDVSPWLLPDVDADTCSDRSFCHTIGRGLGKHQMVPGWPYSIVAALETGRTSWTALLDAIRLEPGADVAAVTAAQVREVVQRIIASGQWRRVGNTVVIADGGYRGTGLVIPHRRDPGQSELPAWKEEHNASHRMVRARFEHAFARMKTWKVLRDCRLKGDDVHHAMLGIAHLHNLARSG